MPFASKDKKCGITWRAARTHSGELAKLLEKPNGIMSLTNGTGRARHSVRVGGMANMGLPALPIGTIVFNGIIQDFDVFQ